ncbi:hypothetical protein POHY109586_14930 [Polaromonas hydrogenivorans]
MYESKTDWMAHAPDFRRFKGLNPGIAACIPLLDTDLTQYFGFRRSISHGRHVFQASADQKSFG